MKLYIITFSLLLGMSSFAQEQLGFYGKRNFIEASSVTHVPLFYNLFKVGYETNGSSLVAKRNWVNTGFHAAVGRVITNNVAISFDFGYNFIRLHELLDARDPDESIDAYMNLVNAEEHESVDVRVMKFMPKIELSRSDGFLPAGFVHQFGLGYTSAKVIMRDYIINAKPVITDPLPIGYVAKLENFVNVDKEYKGLEFMYAVKMRTPVSRWLFISYGFRYTINIPLTSITGVVNERALARSISGQQFLNFFSFDVGLTVPF